jgi:hypothetical protein
LVEHPGGHRQGARGKYEYPDLAVDRKVISQAKAQYSYNYPGQVEMALEAVHIKSNSLIILDIEFPHKPVDVKWEARLVHYRAKYLNTRYINPMTNTGNDTLNI